MFIIKQNDNLPSMEVQFLDPEGNPLNLELCGVRFHMMNSAEEVVLNKEVVVTDVQNGKVKVPWLDGETSEPGIFLGEFKINLPDGNRLTIPNNGYFRISIVSEVPYKE